MSEWLWAPIIIGGAVLWTFLSCEISARISAYQLRDLGYDPRYLRRRLRRAFWDGFTSIGYIPSPRNRRGGR